MVDDKSEKKTRLPRLDFTRLPKPNFDRKRLKRRVRKAEGATIRHANKFVLKRWVNIREVQREVIIWVMVIALLIAASGLQLYWFQRSYQTIAQADDSTYAEAVLGPVDTLNPLFANSSAEQSASYLLFPKLLNYDKTGHINYDLATDIRLNDTKTIYTVDIRSDAKWDDGAKLTSKDVVFTINLMKNPKASVNIPGWEGISVKTIDDNTIEFTLPTMYAPFEHALTFPIIPEHILGDIPPLSLRDSTFSRQPIGSGPFKINFIQDVDTKTGRKVIHLVRNDNYYGSKTKIFRMQLHVYDTNEAVLGALKSNEVNAAAGLSFEETANVNKKQYRLLVEPIQNGVYALLNTKSTLLQDLKIREALRLGTDSNAIRKQLAPGTPSLDLPLTNNQLTGEVPKAPAYNQSEAKRLLDSAGWLLNGKDVRSKDGKELKLSMVTLKNSEFESDVDILSRQWRDLGVAVETKTIDPTDPTQNAVQTILEPRNFDVLIYQLNIGADPDVYAYWHSSQISTSGRNYSNYSNVISDDALVSARSKKDPILRNAKYSTFVKQWLADVPAIGLYQSTMQYVINRDAFSLNSADVLVSPLDRYSTISDWSSESRTVFKTP